MSTETEVINESLIQMAVDTLVTLNDYAEVLSSLSAKAAELVGQTDFQERFLKLIEGIETFADSISQIKTVLNIGQYEAVVALESDLALILKELLESQEKGSLDITGELLKTHLPDNLTQWRTIGLPAIQHTRDC